MHRLIIGNLYVTCFEVKSDVRVNRKIEVWVEAQTYVRVDRYVYCNNCGFRKERHDSLVDIEHLLKNYEDIYSNNIYLKVGVNEDELNKNHIDKL